MSEIDDLARGFKKGVRKMTHGMGYHSRAPPMSMYSQKNPQREYYNEDNEVHVIIHSDDGYYQEPRQYKRNPANDALVGILIILVAIYFIWSMIIKPIIVWFQSLVITTWQNMVLFFQSNYNYILASIFILLFIGCTIYLEKRRTVRLWSWVISGLVSTSITLLIIYLFE